MIEKLKFAFPLSILFRDGNLIITAGEGDPAVGARVGAAITSARALLKTLLGEDTQQAQKKSAAGEMTKEEVAKRKTLDEKMSQLRKSAGHAFKGNDVKLHESYKIGDNKPQDTDSQLRRARTMVAAAKDPADAAALADEGWTADDTKALADAIDAFGTTDLTHETAKNEGVDATGLRNHDANLLYDALVKIQNGASLQYPASNPANTGKRKQFLLETFPPKDSGGGDKKKPDAPKPPA